jgi:hypothetical protein
MDEIIAADVSDGEGLKSRLAEIRLLESHG